MLSSLVINGTKSSLRMSGESSARNICLILLAEGSSAGGVSADQPFKDDE
jgi:hypothetical protein